MCCSLSRIQGGRGIYEIDDTWETSRLPSKEKQKSIAYRETLMKWF